MPDNLAIGPESQESRAAVAIGNDTISPQSAVDPADLTSVRGLWSTLLHRPDFILSAVLITFFLGLAAFPGAFADLFGNGDPRVCDLSRSGVSATSGHPFGFDIQGCDVYANVIYGARPSLTIGLCTTAAITLIAMVLGSASGYYGKLIDAVISRLTDVVFGFPFVLGALVVLTAFNAHSVFTVCLVLTLFGWTTLTRLMRSTVLSTKEADYVLAARGLGASDWRLLRRHVMPNAIRPVVVLAALTVAGVIVSESVLTFLGVGLQAPAISWGLQLSGAQGNFAQHPGLLLWPSGFLAAAVLAFILLGEALGEALNPRLR